MKQIKASEIKPGMEVEWCISGVLHRMTTDRILPHRSHANDLNPDGDNIDGYALFTKESGLQWVSVDQEVTVLTEPQPEEPTELGVKARVRKGRFVRLHEGLAGSNVWFEEGTGYRWTWDDLCEMGPVTVIPDQGWAVAADTLEVPERIEEWPEDDTALRKHKWRDRDGDRWNWDEVQAGWECHGRTGIFLVVRSCPYSWCAPWTRDSDA